MGLILTYFRDYVMQNILVTGGCGFIGSNFLNYMVPKYLYKTFYNLDCLNYCANIKNVTVSGHQNYRFVKGDINSADLINHILNAHQIDTVVHFAAQSHVDNSFGDSLRYTRDNVLGTHTLLECCKQYGGIERFIHVSTDEVYGESQSDEEAKDETHLLQPTNPYAATKAAAEQIVNGYKHSYNFPVIITRGNNVYGPNQYPEKVIPKFVYQLYHGQKCTIQGTGEQLRTFIHVNDVARAFETILFKGELGGIYNIGSDNEYRVLDIAKLIVQEIKGPDTDLSEWVEYVKDRDFNDYRYHIRSDRLHSLDWKEEIPFDEGLKQTIQWYLKAIPEMHWEKIHKEN
jgi:dTDP-glucose 4,6-dehydratase